MPDNLDGHAMTEICTSVVFFCGDPEGAARHAELEFTGVRDYARAEGLARELAARFAGLWDVDVARVQISIAMAAVSREVLVSRDLQR